MTTLQPWPEHQKPTYQDRIASAPYNFVPLPEKIIRAVDSADELPDHDKYYQDRHSGYFDVTLTTRSPLYIRGSLPSKDFPRQEEFKNKPEFFYTHNEREPVIPGSSLRGMLRAVLEIASYSKIKWVIEKRLFFRTVDRSAVGAYYNRKLVEELGTVRTPGNPAGPGYRACVEGGFFRRRADGTYFIEICTVARVDTPDLLKLFKLEHERALYQLEGRNLDEKNARNPNQTPNWSYQHHQIWADIDAVERDYFFEKQFNIDRQNRKTLRHPDLYLRFKCARNLETTCANGKQSGTLVLTGHMNHKHLAFLFVRLKKPATIDVSNDPRDQDINNRLVDRFHDDDQLTPWQKKAFPSNRLPDVQPQPDGRLREGDPVFFLRDENDKVLFFGRAQMFRLPYHKRPLDLVPKLLRRALDIDYAEALFGFVRTHEEQDEQKAANIVYGQGDKGRAYAGRVTVTDAMLTSDPTDIWLKKDWDTPVTPRILATPKPTAFQHYLTQHAPDHPKELDHYDSKAPSNGYSTVIRGHKLYWHQGLGTEWYTPEQMHDRIKETGHISPDDTQHTKFKPLKPEVEFTFRVYFENLSDRELGALCWTLHPRGEQGKRYCHHLGMGKPLGMGAVELHARLHIIDRSARYRHLFNTTGDDWQSGEVSTVEDLADAAVLALRTQDFERHLLDELNPACTQLADMRRIAILLKLLEWPGYPREENRELYLAQEERPNTRYMKIQYPNEYQKRPVLPDPTQFDEPSYFQSKLRPQVSQADQLQVNRIEQNSTLAQQRSMPEAHLQAATRQQAPVKENGQQLVLSSELADLFPVGRELIGLTNFTRSEQGIEVKFWKLDSMKVIGFLPSDLIDRQLGQKISVVVTGLHQEINGRIVVELKLRPK